MSESGRNLIAQALARRGGMSPYMDAYKERLQLEFNRPAPIETGKEWQQRMELKRTQDALKPLPTEMPYQQLYRPDMVPADQPTGEEIPDYLYMKRRL